MIICLILSLACCPTKPDPVITLWDLAPSWSNTGDRITYTTLGDKDSIFTYVLYVIDTNGENQTLLTVGAAYATWLPGDTAIIYHGIDFKLYYMNLSTMQESLLCDCIDSRFPDIDSTGQWLYYEDQGVANNWATSIYKMDLMTGDTTHIVGGSYPRLSPDEKKLLFWRRDTVFYYDLKSGIETKLYTPGFQAKYDWSPDGKEILIGNITRGDLFYKTFRVNSDGTNPRYFTYGNSPRFSPDGKRIAIIRPSGDNKDHVWLIDKDGGNPKQITF